MFYCIMIVEKWPHLFKSDLSVVQFFLMLNCGQWPPQNPKNAQIRQPYVFSIFAHILATLINKLFLSDKCLSFLGKSIKKEMISNKIRK